MATAVMTETTTRTLTTPSTPALPPADSPPPWHPSWYCRSLSICPLHCGTRLRVTPPTITLPPPDTQSSSTEERLSSPTSLVPSSRARHVTEPADPSKHRNNSLSMLRMLYVHSHSSSTTATTVSNTSCCFSLVLES